MRIAVLGYAVALVIAVSSYLFGLAGVWSAGLMFWLGGAILTLCLLVFVRKSFSVGRE